MGGCKCSFYNCSNNTTFAKESNSIHSHFFHFPVRDLKRCVEWAIYSNRMDFLNLTLDKLKNKVICDYHFSENHFMNYTRSKLNKTTAIPTIYINEGKEEIDLLESPTEWVTKNRTIEIPPIFRNMPATKIDIDDSITIEQPILKKMKFESVSSSPLVINKSPPQKIRILNKASTSTAVLPSWSGGSKVIAYKQSKAEVKSPVVHQLPTAVRVQKTKVEKVDENVNQNETQERFEYVTVMQSEEEELPIPPIPFQPPAIPDEIKEFITKTSNDINEIKKQISAPKSQISSPSNITQSNLNKVQLFNGIKRYLSPSLMALLRMELFSGPNREYRKDEKIICGELLKLGEETYDFFNDEWRLRLPNKDEVQMWLNEDGDDENDNDAS